MVLCRASSDLPYMERGELCCDQHTFLVQTDHVRNAGAAKSNAKTRCTCSVLKRLPHNSKSQQKEARTGYYIKKQAPDFAKYLIRGQPPK